jgi:ribosomal protein L35
MIAKGAKTLKLIAKRLQITKRGKVLRRIAGQGHNKSKMPRRLIRIKRKEIPADDHPLIQKAIKKMYQSK